MKLYFITGNKNKLKEIQAILPQVEQLNIDLPEIQSLDAKEIIEAKLQEALAHKKAGFIVEDTSLYFDCLNGLPGPLIKWFMKSMGNTGLYEIAKKFKNTKATAKTIIGYASSSRNIQYFEGIIEGNIITPQGKTDFGWDPIFQPEGYSKSFAEISPSEKNKISMRRLAVNKLKTFLDNKKPIGN